MSGRVVHFEIPTDDIARVGVIKMLSDLGRHEEARAARVVGQHPDDRVAGGSQGRHRRVVASRCGVRRAPAGRAGVS